MTRGALVLCGGRSTRMQRDKAALPFGDEALLQRVVRRITPLVEAVTVVHRAAQDLPTLPDRVRHAHDDVEDQGPLQGLLAGLTAAEEELLFATACDVPFLRPALVEGLFDALGDHAVAVAVAEGFEHPLAAVYRRTVREDIAALLAGGARRPIALYERVPTVRVREDTLRTLDPELESLINCNRPDTYDAALARWRTWPRVQVELFEMARQLAGRSAIDVVARTVHEALEELGSLCPALEGPVVRRGRPVGHWRVSREGRTFEDDLDAPLEDGASLVLVSALAGG